MAQGSKPKALKNIHKAVSSTSKKIQPKDTKKGARVCPPKQEVLVNRAIVHKVIPLLPSLFPRSFPHFSQKNTSSHSAGLERVIATQAVTHGKLTISPSISAPTRQN